MAGRTHQIDENLVSDANHGVLLEFARLEVAHRVVRERGEGGEHPRLVVGVSGDQQVQVHRSPVVASRADGKASDHDIAGRALIQGTAQIAQILERRLARL